MATWKQWLHLLEKGELRRAYYLCGPDQFVAEEIVEVVRGQVEPGATQFISLSAGAVPAAQMWAELNQYPPEEQHRLVVVRNAQRIKSWVPFLLWMDQRQMPGCFAVFLSDDPFVDMTQEHMQRFQKTGRIIRCGPFNREDAILYLTQHGPIDAGVAGGLLDRVGGQLALARQVLWKAALFDMVVDERAVNVFAPTAPAEDYVTCLLAMQVPRALMAAAYVPYEEYSRIIGVLDYRLEHLVRLNRGLRRKMSLRELVSESKVPGALIQPLMAVARYYDTEHTDRCVQALEFADRWLVDGAVEGLLETLAVLW